MHRVEVRLKSHLPDARGLGLTKDIHDLGITTVSAVRVVDVYWLDADLSPDTLDAVCRQLLADPVTEDYYHQSKPHPPEKTSADFHTVEVAYNPEVTEPIEGTIIKALQDLAAGEVRAVKTAHRYLIAGKLSPDELESICSKLLVNPIIQHVHHPARGHGGAAPATKKTGLQLPAGRGGRPAGGKAAGLQRRRAGGNRQLLQQRGTKPHRRRDGDPGADLVRALRPQDIQGPDKARR